MLGWLITLVSAISTFFDSLIAFISSVYGFLTPLGKFIYYIISLLFEFVSFVPDEVATVLGLCLAATLGLNLYRLISRLT